MWALVVDWIGQNTWMFFVDIAICFLAFVFIYDITQKKHTILRNFPVVGHIRYFLETIGPELRQYIVASDKEERPFDRTERSWVYATSKGMNNNFGFGTTELMYEPGYPIIKHKAFPFPENKAIAIGGDPSAIPCLKVIGKPHGRKYPYRPYSIVNISAMSFGSLGKNAISALNMGAKMARAYHNTGEGGVSPYHLKGADVVWQLGTGYFGALGENGKFSLDVVKSVVETNLQIRMIEIKLSQGAKPGKGGILPATKVNAEIAKIRKVPEGKDCISPNAHSEFSNVAELVVFIEKIAEATGLPVGIKSAVGESQFWEDLADEMIKTGKGPDYIVIDGSEGGTGAAPLSYSDHVSLPFKIGFTRVYTTFQKKGIVDRVAWIGAGKLGFPDRTITALAMGCDMIYIAREAMLSIGCIQAQKCHTGHCPAGVATQHWWFERGVDPEIKAKRAAKYIQGFRKELLSLAHTAGYEHPAQFHGEDLEISKGMNKYETLATNLGYTKTPIPFHGMKSLEDFPSR